MSDRPEVLSCRRVGHDYTGSPEVGYYVAGQATCVRCGTVKTSEGRGTVRFTYPTRPEHA